MSNLDYLFPLASYFVGAIPFGLIVGKMAGVDVRGAGSGNIGATNVTRLIGKKFGVITLVLDCLKGYVPIFIASRLLSQSPIHEVLTLSCGVCAVVGHMFPVYLGFRGGKGVATALGVFLFLSPPAIGVSLLVFLATVFLSGFVSAGSLLTAGLLPIWLILFDRSLATVVTGVILAALVWVKHHQNIGRLIRGEEKSWKKVVSPKT